MTMGEIWYLRCPQLLKSYHSSGTAGRSLPRETHHPKEVPVAQLLRAETVTTEEHLHSHAGLHLLRIASSTYFTACVWSARWEIGRDNRCNLGALWTFFVLFTGRNDVLQELLAECLTSRMRSLPEAVHSLLLWRGVKEGRGGEGVLRVTHATWLSDLGADTSS
jgi:hypothetical protein